MSPPDDPRQLALGLPGLPPAEGAGRIPRRDRVFVNRNLQLTGIEWVGFDMDYTLAIYHQDAMDTLSVSVTVERLVRRGWPAHLLRLEFDTRFPIRGLLVDRRQGNVLKMDRHKVVHKGYHGTRPLSASEIEALYHHRRIRPHLARYHWIDTLFSLSEVTAYVAIIDALEKHGEAPDPDRLWADIRECIDEAHRDGTVHRQVMSDLERYVERDPLLARTLHKLRSAGKRLFLLTNSPHGYTAALMRHLLEGAMPEYPSWGHYFDVVIVEAQKPRWFQEGRPFQERDADGPRPLRGGLERLRVYEGGCLAEFEQLLGVVGSSVLYVGDHIYGDMLRSKKESSWRTAMIIPELDQEISAWRRCGEQLTRMRQLAEEHDTLDDELRLHQARFKELAKLALPRPPGSPAATPPGLPEARAEQVRAKHHVDLVRARLRATVAEERRLRAHVDAEFHPYWGSLFKEHNETSSFGFQVDTYADVYTRRVSSFYAYSPQQSFRSPHDLMPHEL